RRRARGDVAQLDHGHRPGGGDLEPRERRAVGLGGRPDLELDGAADGEQRLLRRVTEQAARLQVDAAGEGDEEDAVATGAARRRQLVDQLEVAAARAARAARRVVPGARGDRDGDDARGELVRQVVADGYRRVGRLLGGERGRLVRV